MVSSGGGGSSGVDREAREQELAIERRRLALQEQEAVARARERSLLAQQLAESRQVQERQFSLLRELNQQAIAQEDQLTSLLTESTALARRAAGQQQSEAERAAAAEQQERNRTLAIANTNAVRTSQTRAAPTSTIFNPNERLSILSAFNL